MAKYTRHKVWIAGGRDCEWVIIKETIFGNRRIVHNPSDSIREKATNSDIEFDAGLLQSILICSQGKPVRSSRS